MKKQASVKRFTFVDLFCGAGGLTEGLLLAENLLGQFQLVGASDINDTARMTHVGRFHEQLGLSYGFVVKDIRDEQFLDELVESIVSNSGASGIDVLCGGPPCQGFSVYGSRNEKDPRNDLFKFYIKVVAELRPKYFVMENVPGLVTMYGGKIPLAIKDIVDETTKGNYAISGPIFVNSADFGVPQTRERVIFFGYRNDVEPIDFAPRKVEKWLTVKDAISDLAFLRSWETAKNYCDDFPAMTQYQIESRRGRLFHKLGIPREDNSVYNHEAAKHTPDVIARFAMVEKGRGLESIPVGLWAAHLKTDKKWCVRLDENKPSYTVTTLPDDMIHYSNHRILTVREMARLQSFDDTYVFRGPRATGGGGVGNRKRLVELPQYTQVGNAVPPLLGKIIGETLLQSLIRTEREKEMNEDVSVNIS